MLRLSFFIFWIYNIARLRTYLLCSRASVMLTLLCEIMPDVVMCLYDLQFTYCRYYCPLYRIPSRTDKNFIFEMVTRVSEQSSHMISERKLQEIRTEDSGQKWIQRGVCCLCSRDE
jgi:hypothetical protein